MSRCFPYPPPHFGQAEIESIKLLKEEKAKKHKEKAKRQKSHEKEMALNSNHDGKQHKKRKHQEKSEDERSHKKQKSEKKQHPLVANLCSQKTSETLEQLEKSGLTEEHEHPCSIQHKLDSPESSQDSSKRRKLVPSSSIHETQGNNTLRIKLPSFRQRAAEPSPLPLSRQTEPQPPSLSRQTELQPPFPPSGQAELASLSSRQIKPQQALSTSLEKVKLPSASSRQIKPQPSLPHAGLGELAVSRKIKVRKQLPPPDQVDSTAPLSAPSGQVEPPLSRQTKLQPPLPPSRRVEQVMPSPRQKLQPPWPKHEPVELAMPLQRQAKLKPPLPLAPRQGMPSLLSSSKQTTQQQQGPLPTQLCPKPLDLKAEKQLVDKKPAAVAEQPCSSSKASEEAAATTKKASRKKRIGGRTWQKEQYEILVANWNPQAAMKLSETSVLCEDDDDWLAVAPRQQRCHANESTTSNAAGSIRENHAVASVQPLACYLPELNMYQLPYVVPF